MGSCNIHLQQNVCWDLVDKYNCSVEILALPSISWHNTKHVVLHLAPPPPPLSSPQKNQEKKEPRVKRNNHHCQTAKIITSIHNTLYNTQLAEILDQRLSHNENHITEGQTFFFNNMAFKIILGEKNPN